MALVPAKRPDSNMAYVVGLTNNIKCPQTDLVHVIGVRGYYDMALGAKTVNHIGLYDDALFVVSPTCFAGFNFNVDPGVERVGMANLRSLKDGDTAYRYKPGIHGLNKAPALRYPAFVQAGQVTVDRYMGEGIENKADTGFFGINIHRGGVHTVSSLGCQTVPPEQWDAAHSLILSELARHGQTTFPYFLVEA